MQTNYIIPVLTIALAGIFNGSYPAFLAKLPYWTEETKWFFFSFSAFLVMPLISITLVSPHWLIVLGHVSTLDLSILTIGGLLFGIGMILFTWALRLIGIGVAFVLNISLGTVFGSLVPMLTTDHLFSIETKIRAIDVGALTLFVFAVLLISIATSIRDKDKQQSNNGKPSWYKAVLGITCGCFSGLFCAAQGASYGLVSPNFTLLATKLGISKFSSLATPWLIIFSCAFLIYAAYHYALIRRRGLYITSILRKTPWFYYIYLTLMGCVYFLPLIMYSHSVSMLGRQGPIIGWPLLMCFIVFSSNAWSCIRGEWSQARWQEIGIFSLALIFLIGAVMVLSWGSKLSLETNIMISKIHGPPQGKSGL